MSILAIDPGNAESAFLYMYELGGVPKFTFEKRDNESLLNDVRGRFGGELQNVDLVIERVACMGMAVGETVFETVFWSGRFAEAWGAPFHRIKRGEVKMHLCGTMRAKDANIRQALIDRFGAPGTKKNPGATYGISGDIWAALAVAVTFYDKQPK